MTITTTKLYKLLSLKIGDETAESLTTFIEEKVKEDIDTQSQIFLTKEDKIDLIDRLNRHFIILLSTLLTIGGTLIAIAIQISSKLKG